MKHIRLFVGVFLTISLLLTSCNTAAPVTPDNLITTPPEPTIPAESTTIEDRIAVLEGRTITEEDRITIYSGGALRSSGGGYDGIGGAMYLAWYNIAFGDRLFHGIPAYVLEIVEDYGAVKAWLRQRHWFERIGLLAFLEDFNITAGDLIRAQETYLNRPMAEIDAYVNWARYGIYTGFSDPINQDVWERFYSISDIEAFFSGDVYRLWAIDPGYGVVQNNRAYSPAWIINNIERAVVEEQIPENEIWRIIGIFENYPELYDEIALARNFLESSPQGQ